MANGYYEIVTATDLRFERILKRAGWPMQRLGRPCPIGSTMAVAGVLPADAASLHRIRAAACHQGHACSTTPLLEAVLTRDQITTDAVLKRRNL